ncbi:PTS sugar transporter subunit IIA [Enterococcus gilvus]|uniref:PTS sugar transporter subunit IIA n=1 Tax=Enterococcus gilvus TaxID=160453 RepID=UPI001C8C4ED8|nr:PTS sugar transporter subunit IIA [Enterococcus gilvus]MBX8936792.1 PTS sugar transporter subunit IIA [Enterococcus gilvus]
MLQESIEESYIQLDVEAENFEEAIKKSFDPLIENGAVTNKYVEAVIRIYQETGPYIVITKNIALPHAPVEDGANKLGLGFVRLKVPVVSGHKTNDPVKYLFPLSAKASNDHIELLSKLADLLSQQRFIEFLEQVSSKEEFINYFNQQ